MEFARTIYGAFAAPVTAVQIAALQTSALPAVRVLESVINLAFANAMQILQGKAVPRSSVPSSALVTVSATPLTVANASMDGVDQHATFPRAQIPVLDMAYVKTVHVPAMATGPIRIAHVLAARAFVKMDSATTVCANATLGGWEEHVPYQLALVMLMLQFLRPEKRWRYADPTAAVARMGSAFAMQDGEVTSAASRFAPNPAVRTLNASMAAVFASVMRAQRSSVLTVPTTAAGTGFAFGTSAFARRVSRAKLAI